MSSPSSIPVAILFIVFKNMFYNSAFIMILLKTVSQLALKTWIFLA